MINTLKSLFKELLEGEDLGRQNGISSELAIACLLVEVAKADHNLDAKEQESKTQLLKKLCGVEQEKATSLIEDAEARTKDAASLYEFTSQLRSLSREQRFDLIKAMWEMAFADGNIDPLEDSVIRKTAELIYVDHSEFIRAKLQVTGE
ncbi:TerB family tellurite resistance protein [Vibrio viridaestus]|uniref:TerB family tellurite resistance protein n=1 Tax=Vibrio viridaestus TaxID=2487322 RepID=A0A3N9THD3_9VIBR|nr:TerB family tellurite resistance protein [Vibrio viridaestus]RQW63637.1 TerB family tellurite resistance protein [Vibrio viridaestus]